MADDECSAGMAVAYHHPTTSPPATWGHQAHIYPHSHHGTPAQEYPSYAFPSPPGTVDTHPYIANTAMQPRLIQQQYLDPIVTVPTPPAMPRWPSMLNTQSHPSQFQPVQLPTLHSIQPAGQLQTPISATSTRSLATPRKTLTDMDRKKMCVYAEENPNAKQMEIGALFGVERSTVSKVLRQKEKYLQQDEGSRSPIKRIKGRSPDVERALVVWARNQQKKGIPLDDTAIRDKARAFSATTTLPDNHQPLSSSWIEKFKLKYNLLGARSRRGSQGLDDTDVISVHSSSASQHGRGGATPVSPTAGSPLLESALRHVKSLDSIKNESPDSITGAFSTIFQSDGMNAPSSAFTDTAPLSPNSALFTPDMGTAPSPFTTTAPIRPILPTSVSDGAQRPRRQTFPLLDQYVTEPPPAMPITYVSHATLDSPMSDAGEISNINPLGLLNEALQPIVTEYPDHRLDHEDSFSRTVSPSDTMRPPPLPTQRSFFSSQFKKDQTNMSAATSTEEAQRALKVLMKFFQQQPDGFLDFHESVTLGKLMEKLKLQHSRERGPMMPHTIG